MRGREAFQEIDYRQMFGGIAKWVCRDRRPGADPGAGRARLPHRDLGPAGAGRARAARGHADRARGLRRCRPLPAGPGPSRAPRTWRACACCCRLRQAAVHDPRRRRLERQGLRRHPRRSPRRSTCRSGCRSGARTTSTTRIAAMPATSASRSRRRSATGCATPTSCSWSGPAWARPRAAATRLIDVPEPQQTLVHVHPGAEELGLVYTPDLSIHAGVRAFAAAARALAPVDTSAWRARDRGRARAVPRVARAPPRRPASCSSARSWSWLREHLPRGRHRHQRRRQLLRLGQRLLPVPGLPDAARADQRLDGLRHAGGDRRQAGPSGAHRGRVRRRRLLPDDRPGARDRGAVRPAGSSGAWSTTACTARSACTRSATIPAAWSAPTSRTRTSRRSPAPMAAMARWSSAPPTSPPPSGAPSRPRQLRAARPAGRSRGAHAPLLDQPDPRRRAGARLSRPRSLDRARPRRARRAPASRPAPAAAIPGSGARAPPRRRPAAPPPRAPRSRSSAAGGSRATAPWASASGRSSTTSTLAHARDREPAAAAHRGAGPAALDACARPGPRPRPRRPRRLRARPRAITTVAPARSPLTLTTSPHVDPDPELEQPLGRPARRCAPPCRAGSRGRSATAGAASANSARVRLGVSAKIRPP